MLSVTFDLSHRKVRLVKEMGINAVAWSKEEVKTGPIHLSVILCVHLNLTVTASCKLKETQPRLLKLP